MAELVSSCVKIPQNAILVPLPTIGKHVRERGFDHTKHLVRKLARISGAQMKMLIKRVNNTTQVGASEAERKQQAKKAYMVDGKIDYEAQYILVDDVWTTGSSMLEATKRIQEKGITKIGAMIIAKSG